MRITHIISTAALSLLFFASCDIATFEQKAELAKLSSPSDFKAPVLREHAAVIADQDNIKTEEVNFSWTSAEFGQNLQIEYSLYMSYDGNKALLGQTTSTYYSISKTDYMGLLCNSLKAPKNVKLPQQVKTYVVAKPAETDDSYCVTSNTIAYDVTTYVPTKRQIYLPGKYNGWGQYNCPFWETDGGSNIYKTLVDVSNTEETPYYFKLVLSDGSWTGFDKIATDGWTVADESNNDCNYSVTEGNGIVRLTVNLSTNKISKETLSAVEIIGDFDSWAGTAMTFDPNENVWKADATYATDGGLLIRLNKDWNMKFGNGTKASEEVEGGVILDEDTNSANISVAAGSYTMILHANRTPFVLVMSKK